MQQDRVREERDRIIREDGPWTLHNFKLSENVWTIGEENNPLVNPYIDGLRRIAQISSDLLGGKLAGARIADLGSGEGGFAVELAMHGARVTAVEGREISCRKILFAKEALSLETLEVVPGDVRKLGKGELGSFDIVLCIGLLYHLDAPDVFDFVKSIHALCTKAAIFDTQLATVPILSRDYENRTYYGKEFVEHVAQETRAANAPDELWSSLDNPRSFWFTAPSLMNLLGDVGFSSVYECRNPYTKPPRRHSNRVTMVAIKGNPVPIMSVPDQPQIRWPDNV